MPLRSRALLAFSAAALAACSGSKGGGTGVAAVTVDPQAAALCVGDTLTFTAHLLDASGDTIPGSQIRWTSSAPQTVAVDSVSGLAHALALGTVQISASVGGLRSANPGRLDVPSDLDPQFVPDTVVLAPNDTFTLGARLKRKSAGPVPNHLPVITPSSDAVASLGATGLAAAKTVGTSSLALTACGFTGHGAARVFTPPDSLTGLGYLWLSGPAELRVSMGTVLHNFTLTSKKPAFQLFGSAAANTRQFGYEDTLQLAAIGSYALDSLLSTEATATTACNPPRPFATYGDNSAFTSLFSMHGGLTTVSTYSTVAGFRRVSGRVTARMRGIISAVATTVDTLQAIYTFSAPLRDTTGVCP